jgi:AcrR family transcriptional regulator
VTPVKRTYDATSRRAEARRRRAAVVAVAHELFLAEGYAATTVGAVAARSGVSVESVYQHFAGKPGLLRAVVARALEGTSDRGPAESRSDQLPAEDLSALVGGWGRLAAEVAPLVSPVLLLVESAAAQHGDARALADELAAERMRRMSSNAQRLMEAGHLATGVTLEEAQDVLWTLSSPELYDLLVRRRGWSPQRYGDFVARGILGQLCAGGPDQPSREGASVSGMGLANELLTDGFDRVRETVQQVVQGLDEEQLAFRPAAEANPVGWLVWHLTRVQDDHVADVAGGEQIWTAGGWVERFRLPFDVGAIGYGHSSAEVGQVRATAEMLDGYQDAVHRSTVDYLATLADEDYARVVDDRWDPPVTLAVRLVSVLNDTTQHVGQAAYVRGLIDRRG